MGMLFLLTNVVFLSALLSQMPPAFFSTGVTGVRWRVSGSQCFHDPPIPRIYSLGCHTSSGLSPFVATEQCEHGAQNGKT